MCFPPLHQLGQVVGAPIAASVGRLLAQYGQTRDGRSAAAVLAWALPFLPAVAPPVRRGWCSAAMLLQESRRGVAEVFRLATGLDLTAAARPLVIHDCGPGSTSSPDAPESPLTGAAFQHVLAHGLAQQDVTLAATVYGFAAQHRSALYCRVAGWSVCASGDAWL